MQIQRIGNLTNNRQQNESPSFKAFYSRKLNNHTKDMLSEVAQFYNESASKPGFKNFIRAYDNDNYLTISLKHNELYPDSYMLSVADRKSLSHTVYTFYPNIKFVSVDFKPFKSEFHPVEVVKGRNPEAKKRHRKINGDIQSRLATILEPPKPKSTKPAEAVQE